MEESLSSESALEVKDFPFVPLSVYFLFASSSCHVLLVELLLSVSLVKCVVVCKAHTPLHPVLSED